MREYNGNIPSICFEAYTLAKKKSGFKYFYSITKLGDRPGVSNSTCSVGHMRSYKVSHGPHYNERRYLNLRHTMNSSKNLISAACP